MGTEIPYIVDDPPESALNADVVDMDSPPTVSFCIPTYNEGRILRDALESIRAQAYDRVEIIVVDGNSDDETADIAREYTDKVYTDTGSLGSARQESLRRATGEITALFDADIIIPHEDWLTNAVRRFNYDENVSTVWARNVTPPEASALANLYRAHANAIMEDRVANQRGYAGGGNSLFRRDHLEAIGGINPDRHWGEDFDWAMKLAEGGYQVLYYRDELYHATMESWRQFAGKQFTAAEAFADSGFGLMGMSTGDVLYEQYWLGVREMVRGLRNGESYWALYPLYASIKTVAFAYTYVRQRL